MKKEKIKNKFSSEEIDVTRYHSFMLLAYPEWSNYNDILTDIRSSFKYLAFITHEPDCDELKVHTHIIIHLDDGRTLVSISKRVGIPLNLIKPVKSIRGSLRYLSHIDFPERKLYDLDLIYVSKPFHSDFLKAYDDIETEDDKLNNIYLFIQSHSNLDPFNCEMELSRYVNSSNYIAIYRRFYNTIEKYIGYVCRK